MEFLSVASGSSGNAVYISDGHTSLLIDCGISGKCLAEGLLRADISPDSLDAVLITHEHIDHVAGVGVISRRYKLPVYATEKTFAACTKIGKPEKFIPIEKHTDFSIGSIGVRAFSVSHDAADPVGYSFFTGNKKFTVATDTGIITENIRKEVINSDTVLLESNHDVEMLKFGSYNYDLKRRVLSDEGHLSNDAAADFSAELLNTGTKKIILGHLSHENNTPDIAYKTSENKLISLGAVIGGDIILSVAKRSEVTLF
ncbi:MAG: MBL fold metallo-hydrolase [Oscillospiraceae bacterium]|nr:MBL fold metallo-hydrolase [Oscillospiraceae bacterium]